MITVNHVNRMKQHNIKKTPLVSPPPTKKMKNRTKFQLVIMFNNTEFLFSKRRNSLPLPNPAVLNSFQMFNKVVK